jgi:hypothetical protein
MRGSVYVKGYWRRKPVRKTSTAGAKADRPRKGTRKVTKGKRKVTRSPIMRFLLSAIP